MPETLVFRNRHPILSSAGVIFLVGLIVFFGRSFIQANAAGVDVVAQTYRIPPTFGASRILMAATLSLLSIMSLLAMQAVLENVRFLIMNKSARDMPVKVAVVNETMILCVVVCGVLPDALVLYAWGELMAPSNAVLSKLDRYFDMVAACIFIFWCFRRLRTRPTILFQLQREPIPVDKEPTWEQLRPKLLISAAIILISVGVAFGK